METNPGNKEVNKVYQHKSNFHMTKKTKTRRNWKKIVVILAVILAIGGLLVYIGVSIYDNGYTAGLEKGKKSTMRSSSSRDARPPLPSLPFQPIVGRVVDVKGDIITLDTIGGEKKMIIVGSTTKITKKNTALSLADIKKDLRVTAFLQGMDGDTQVASRIIVE